MFKTTLYLLTSLMRGLFYQAVPSVKRAHLHVLPDFGIIWALLHVFGELFGALCYSFILIFEIFVMVDK